MTTKIIYYLIILISPLYVFSQAPEGDFTSIEITPEQDTLILQRKHGDWWFGGYFGYNYNVYYGDLKITPNLFEENNPFYTNISFKNGKGSGYHIGGIAEWLPVGKNWGAQLKVTFLDLRDNNTENRVTNDTFNTIYSHDNSLGYITISPSVRYNFLFEGFHLFSGIDIEIPINGNAHNVKEFYNPEYIIQNSVINFKKINTRIGLNVGLGYDIFMLDYNHRTRIRFTPYVSLHYGTTVIGDNNSNWNTLLSRIGMAIKLGPDKILADTIKYDPSYQPAPEYYASAMPERGIEFPEYRFAESLPAAKIGYMQIAGLNKRLDTIDLTDAEIIEAFSPEVVNPEDIDLNVPEQEEVAQEIKSNESRVFEYPSSASTEITPDTKQYLDNIVKLYQQNKNIQVRIVGHSDNAGTLIQNTERSNIRANKIKQYLLNKGLPEGVLLSRGVGSIDPIGPINTPAGRAKNRRVEITVVQ